MANLSDKAMLVSLNIRQWVGRKLDRNATQSVENAFSTDKAVGNYTKKLLPGANELAEVGRQATALRSFFYQETLPWMNDGSRIIASKNYMQFTKEFRTKKGEFENAVSQFIAEYPQLRADAKNKLGSLFHDAEYPSVGKLANRFSCDITFLPLPSVEDFRVSISDNERKEFIARMREIEANATKDCWQRLHDVVSKAVTKLQTPDGIFRDSLIENITDICTLLPRLNVTDDPKLEKARKDIEKLVAGMSVDNLRNQPSDREQAAKQLESAMSKMAAFV